MPYPKTLLSLYPPENFTDIIKQHNPEMINVYVDLKNVMTSMFVPAIIEEIALNTKNNGKLDSSIFQSVIFYASWWKKFCSSIGVKCSIHISSDYGQSVYHDSVYPDYKKNRRISGTPLTPYDEDFREIKLKNTQLLANVIKKIPGVHFYLMDKLEADFIPYYLMTRKFDNPKIFHVLCSNDHDMYQVLNKPNIIQLFKYRGLNKILTKDTYMDNLLGIHKQSVNSKCGWMDKINKFDTRYLSALLAVTGDSGDDVPGVVGYGSKKALNLFNNMDVVRELIGDPDELVHRVSEGGMFLKEYDPNKDYGDWNSVLSAKVMKNKGETDVKKIQYFDINELLSISYKLQSFEQLCLWLEKKDKTSKFDWIRYIDFVLDKQPNIMIPSASSFMAAASKLEDNYLTESDISVFYQ